MPELRDWIAKSFQAGFELGCESCQTDSFAAEGEAVGKAKPQPPRVSPAVAALLDKAEYVVSQYMDFGLAQRPNSIGIKQLQAAIDAVRQELAKCATND